MDNNNETTQTVEAPAKQYVLSDLILEGSREVRQNIHRYVDFTYDAKGEAEAASACANGAAYLALVKKIGAEIPKRDDSIQWDRRFGKLDGSFKDEDGRLQALAMVDAYVTAPYLQPTTKEVWDALTKPPEEPLVDTDDEESGGDFHMYTSPPEFEEGDVRSFALSRAIDYANYNRPREEVAEILASLGW